MISHKYKCIFIHIPATGGSSMEHALCGKDWDEIDLMTKHMSADIAKIHYKKYWHKYFKFSFVRNPFDWFVSVHMLAKKKHFSFKEYVKHTINFGSMHWNFTWDRIYVPLSKNFKEIDFIGRFESLTDDFGEVSKRIGFSGKLPIRWLHKNLGKKDYKSYYDDETKNFVEQNFKEDLLTFGYTFDKHD